MDVSNKKPVRCKSLLFDAFEIGLDQREKFKGATYYVRDPFNSTYNPAKALKGEQNRWFQTQCSDALKELNEKGVASLIAKID